MRRSATVSGLAAAVMALAACAGPAPGVAASVEDQEISVEQVDDFAVLICSVGNLPGGSAGTPSRTARLFSLELLIRNALALDLIDEDTVDPAEVSAIVRQTAGVRETVPDDLVPVFDDFIRDEAVVQAGIVPLGREALLADGASVDDVTDEAASQRGQELLQEYAGSADVELDPRFGSYAEGTVAPDSGSLSVPVSDLAKAGSDTTGESDLSGLVPDSQLCTAFQEETGEAGADGSGAEADAEVEGE